jgi:hypothetical protein
MIDKLKRAIAIATEKQGITNPIINLEHPEDNTFGDFSSNVALVIPCFSVAIAIALFNLSIIFIFSKFYQFPLQSF